MGFYNYISVYEASSDRRTWIKRGKNYDIKVWKNSPYGIFFTSFTKETLFCIKFTSCENNVHQIAANRSLGEFLKVACSLDLNDSVYFFVSVKDTLKIIFLEGNFFCREGHEIPVHFVKMHITPSDYALLNHTYVTRVPSNLHFYQIKKNETKQENFFILDFEEPEYKLPFAYNSSAFYNTDCKCSYVKERIDSLLEPNMKIPDDIFPHEKILYSGTDADFQLVTWNEKIHPRNYETSRMTQKLKKKEFSTILQNVLLYLNFGVDKEYFLIM